MSTRLEIDYKEAVDQYVHQLRAKEGRALQLQHYGDRIGSLLTTESGYRICLSSKRKILSITSLPRTECMIVSIKP